MNWGQIAILIMAGWFVVALFVMLMTALININPREEQLMATWSFVDGVKVIDGRRVPLVRSQTYRSSNGNTIYTRSWWADNTQSCNCPGWTLKVNKATGERTCGHTQGKKEGFAVSTSEVRADFKMVSSSMVVAPGRRLIGKEE